MAPSAQTKKLILDGSLFVLSQVAFYYAFKVRTSVREVLPSPLPPPPALPCYRTGLTP